MTAAEFVVVRCDAPGCRKRFPRSGRPHPGSHLFVRAQAGLVGWLWSSSRGDFCPEHTSILRPGSTSGETQDGA